MKHLNMTSIKISEYNSKIAFIIPLKEKLSLNKFNGDKYRKRIYTR